MKIASLAIRNSILPLLLFSLQKKYQPAKYLSFRQQLVFNLKLNPFLSIPCQDELNVVCLTSLPLTIQKFDILVYF